MQKTFQNQETHNFSQFHGTKMSKTTERSLHYRTVNRENQIYSVPFCKTFLLNVLTLWRDILTIEGFDAGAQTNNH